MVSGWWGLALCTQGRSPEADQHLLAVNEMNRRGGKEQPQWGFYEYCNTETGRPGGTPLQTWSATAGLMLEGALEGKQLYTGQ